MTRLNSEYTLKFQKTDGHCPAGETFAKQMIKESALPVLSCEGSCIRGEIARLAANHLSQEPGYGRACHGEIFSVPQSTMAQWAEKAKTIIVIDGCFLHCHGRILEGIYQNEQLAIFDALSYYKKYTDKMAINEVPEQERIETAQLVFEKVKTRIDKGRLNEIQPITAQTGGCCSEGTPEAACCGE